jgi:hypothetical protein
MKRACGKLIGEMLSLISILGLDPEDLRWHDLAMCKGMDREDFYDNYESNPNVAKITDEVCLSCPVLKECLQSGIDNGDYGVWGGFYLTAGKPDPNRNSHKSKDTLNRLRERIGKH